MVKFSDSDGDVFQKTVIQFSIERFCFLTLMIMIFKTARYPCLSIAGSLKNHNHQRQKN